MDDCFSKKRKDEPDQLLDRLNNYHPNIKFTVEENPDHFLDTAFSYGNDGFDCKVYKKPGKLPTHWSSEVPTKWKRNCITGALHRAKNISTNLDRDIKEIKTTFSNAGYPKKFVSCTIDNFISNNSSEGELLIPHFLFEERKKIASNSPTARRMKSQTKGLFQNWTPSLISSIFSSFCGKLDNQKSIQPQGQKPSQVPRYLRRRMLMRRKLCR